MKDWAVYKCGDAYMIGKPRKHFRWLWGNMCWWDIGYGYAEFKDLESAKTFLKKMRGEWEKVYE